LVFGYWQPVNPETDHTKYTLTDWAWYPLETNPAARLFELSGPLCDVAAAPDGSVLCVVGAGGFIGISHDGGATWKPGAIPENAKLAAPLVTKAVAPTRAVVPNSAVAPSTAIAPGSVNGLYPRWPHLYAACFADRTHGWAVGERGTILATTDGGLNWQQQPSGVEADLTCVAFYDATTGYAGGSGATVLRFSGGQWQPVPPESAAKPADDPPPIDQKQPFDEKQPGQPNQNYPNSKAQLEAPPLDALLVRFQSPNAAALPALPPWPAVTDHIAPIGPDTGLAMIERQNFAIHNGTVGIGKVDEQYPATFFAHVGDSSQIAIIYQSTYLTGERTTWPTTSREAPSFLDGPPLTGHEYFVDFAFQRPGRLIGLAHLGKESAGALKPISPEWMSGGEICLIPVAALAPVTDKPPPTEVVNIGFRPLRVAVAGDRAWVIGENGEVLGSRDAARRWYPLTQAARRAELSAETATSSAGEFTNLRLPAPWVLAVGFLVPLAVGLVFRVLRPDPDQPPPGIADSVLSDKPLTAGERDALNFTALARGISRFLRNVNTAAPLTISVDGPWGSGKSSLMNLIQSDLESYGFRTVWFNAWHHQREESLLAALLESLRRKAAPSLFDLQPGGIRYRLKLWWRKIRSPAFYNRLLLIAALLLIARFVLPANAIRDVLRQAVSLQGIQVGEALQLLLATVMGAVGGTQAFEAIRRLAAFTVQPAELLATKSQSSRLSELERQTSLRFRFAQEFHDFCEAFKPRNLIIFIDDLDRCDPETVAMTLECVNYLVSSGDCYFVLGMDYHRIQTCIAQKYASEVKTTQQLAGAADPTAGLSDFSRRYLEKLINLQVRLPESTTEQRAAMLVPESEEVQRSAGDRRWPVEIPRKLAKICPPGLVAATALLAGAIALSWPVLFPPPAPLLTAKPPSTTTNQPDRTTPGAVEDAAPVAATGPNLPDSAKAELVISPRKLATEVAWVLLGLGGAALLSVLIVQLLTPDVGIVHDSPRFAAALRSWLPLLERKEQTPRALKRFMNEVRYRSMLRGSGPQQLTSLEYLLVLVGWKLSDPPVAGAAGDSAESIDESSLVALSVLHRCLPAWPASASELAAAAQKLIQSDGLSSEQQTHLTADLPQLVSHAPGFLDLLRSQAKFQ
jgi:photosystem II stability/assembly factor-like uncharacterized protein